MKPAIILLGNCSMDVIRTKDGVIKLHGGPVLFCARVFNESKVCCGVVSRIGSDFDREQFNGEYIDTEGIQFCDGATACVDLSEEDISISDYAPLDLSKIPQKYLAAEAFLISTLFEDIPIDYITVLKNKGKYIFVDVQGFLNCYENGKYCLRKKDHLLAVLQHIDLIKMNLAEMETLFEEKDLSVVAKLLAQTGTEAIISCDKDGAILLCGGKVSSFPTEPLPIEFALGCGDTLFARFIANLLKGLDKESAILNAQRYVYGLLRSGKRFAIGRYYNGT